MFLFSECSALPFNRNPTDSENGSIWAHQDGWVKFPSWNYSDSAAIQGFSIDFFKARHKVNKDVSVSELDLCCRAHLEPLWKPIDLLVNYDDDTDWSAGLLGAPTVCLYLGEARQLREAYWWGCPVQSSPDQRLPKPRGEPGRLKTKQTRQVGGPKMETGLGLPDDREGKWKNAFGAPKLSTDSLQYLFTFSTTVLHFCIYAIGGFPTAWRCSCNSSFIGLWNTCSRPVPCKKKQKQNGT